MLFTPSPCHKLSHLLGPPPPPSSVTYFLEGPLPFAAEFMIFRKRKSTIKIQANSATVSFVPLDFEILCPVKVDYLSCFQIFSAPYC